MKRTSTLALALSLACGSAAPALETSFQQLNWLDADGGVMIFASRVGVAEFRFDPSDPQDLLLLADNGGGWINLAVTSLNGEYEWVVRNLYVVYPDPNYLATSAPSVQFGLPGPDGLPAESLIYQVMVTPQPLLDPPMGPEQFGPVELVDYHAGGFNGGGSSLAHTPFIIGPWIGPFLPPLEAAWTWIPADEIQPVDEGINGCAPASAARSIEYLGRVHDFETDSAQDIYEDLHEDMETDPATGTSVEKFLEGKDDYTGREGLPIETRQIFGPAGIDQAIKDLADGCDVEIMIAWDPEGGHAAMITSIVKHADGSYTITYVDDPTQGDGVAENREHVIHVQPDGSFPGGLVFGVQIECVVKDLPGDVDGDGKVDQQDLALLLAAFGSVVGDANFNPDADFNGDGTVDQADLAVLLGNWGQGA